MIDTYTTQPLYDFIAKNADKDQEIAIVLLKHDKEILEKLSKRFPGGHEQFDKGIWIYRLKLEKSYK